MWWVWRVAAGRSCGGSVCPLSRPGQRLAAEADFLCGSLDVFFDLGLDRRMRLAPAHCGPGDDDVFDQTQDPKPPWNRHRFHLRKAAPEAHREIGRETSASLRIRGRRREAYTRQLQAGRLAIHLPPEVCCMPMALISA